MSSALHSPDDEASLASSSSTFRRERVIHLLDLPDEVLVLIFQQLQPGPLESTFPPRFPSSKSYTELTHSWTLKNELPWPQPASKPLCAIARVCRRANQLATPLLYHAVTLQTMASTNRLSLSLRINPSLGLLVRHLNLPNDGLLHGSSDRMADKESWLLSLRTILHQAWRLESISISTRPGGEALQELFSHTSSVRGGMVHLQRITVSSLSFSFPVLGASGLEAPNLTHIHLIQWIPPTLMERFGSNLFNGLEVLRLSRIPASIFRLPVDMFLQSKGLISAQQIFDQCIHTSPQPLFLLLRECIEQYTQLRRILLEFEQLADLDTPEGYTPRLAEREASVPSPITSGQDHSVPLPITSERDHPAAAFVPSLGNAAESRRSRGSTHRFLLSSAGGLPTSTGGFGAPFDQFAPGQLGQLASLDFPADVPLSAAESQEWARRAEEDRCRERRQHWYRLAQFKALLVQYAQEMRESASFSSSSSTFAPLQVSIVAARPMGWDRNDSLVDFHANARACQGGGGGRSDRREDLSAFQDEDIFELVKRYPHLGHDYANDGWGNKVAYWTGALPHPDGNADDIILIK